MKKIKNLKFYSKSIFFGQNLTQTRIFTDVLGGSVVEYLSVPILQLYTVYTRSMFICLFCGYGLTGVGRWCGGAPLMSRGGEMLTPTQSHNN